MSTFFAAAQRPGTIEFAWHPDEQFINRGVQGRMGTMTFTSTNEQQDQFSVQLTGTQSGERVQGSMTVEVTSPEADRGTNAAYIDITCVWQARGNGRRSVSAGPCQCSGFLKSNVSQGNLGNLEGNQAGRSGCRHREPAAHRARGGNADHGVAPTALAPVSGHLQERLRGGGSSTIH